LINHVDKPCLQAFAVEIDSVLLLAKRRRDYSTARLRKKEGKMGKNEWEMKIYLAFRFPKTECYNARLPLHLSWDI
jgi:hypothetical protein